MKQLQTEEVKELFKAIRSLKTEEECYLFFEDAFTVKEILDVAQRLQAAKMLKSGENYVNVCKQTGMSSATVSRVNRCLSYGNGGYELVLERLKESEGK
jgi:TrpR-related protein YerC/YecD